MYYVIALWCLKKHLGQNPIINNLTIKKEGVVAMKAEKRFVDLSSNEREQLFKKDPALFEELARAALEEVCNSQDPERTVTLRQMQWNIDKELRKSKTPLGKLMIMQNIFYARVFGSEGCLSQIIANATKVKKLALEMHDEFTALKGGKGE